MDDIIAQRIQDIKDNPSLPPPPPEPRLPDLHCTPLVRQKVTSIQRFVESFEYNYTGQPFVRMLRSRGMSHIASCAKQIIRAALPIQCVEAVFLGCILTAELKTVDRVPLSFKSKMGDTYHRHIVLALRHDNKWGAIGISRRSNLMNKDFRFDTLSQLVENFEKSYESCFHKLLVVYVGLPFSHDVHSDMPIKWRAVRVSLNPQYRNHMIEQLETYATSMLKVFEIFQMTGKLPESINRRTKLPEFHRRSRSLTRSIRSDSDTDIKVEQH